MTNISLREYVNDVENLLAKGKAAYAEQHCRHILRFFPKHIKIYRLMGKSCLVNEKPEEAADIFLRVLSVIPDDFASLVGLGIIAEDAGDLDSAICYMEMAGEIDPSDQDIQSEIRRLYNKRDGVSSERIRITRGALIRTYLRGELFDQAIAKARTAFTEEPNRIDFQLLLARAYYQSGKKMEAAETCTQIIKKLPHCLEANKILYIICSSMNRPVESQLFQKRISEIEPYSAHISKSYSSPGQVPDDAIMLERLDVPLKEDELFLHEDGEPTSELIKILYSPSSTPADEVFSDAEVSSSAPVLEDIPFTEKKDFNPPFVQELPISEQDPLSSTEEIIGEEPIKEETAISETEQFPLNETGLPDWLQNYSFGPKISHDKNQDESQNLDFMDFLYQGKQKFPNEPTIRKFEPPSIQKSGVDQISSETFQENNQVINPSNNFSPLTDIDFGNNCLSPNTTNKVDDEEFVEAEDDVRFSSSPSSPSEETVNLREQLRKILLRDTKNVDIPSKNIQSDNSENSEDFSKTENL